MSGLSIAPLPGERLAAWFSPERRAAGGREQRFECASAGDVVSGRCWWPDAPPRALVLAVHDLARGKDEPALGAAAAVWSRAGAATAAIDLPLHGERFNAKLTPRAVAASAPGATADLPLWRGLLAQSLRDLARTLDTLATRAALPRVVCVAFGASAPIAAAFSSLDRRVAAAAAIGAPRALPPELAANPLDWLARPDDLSLPR